MKHHLSIITLIFIIFLLNCSQFTRNRVYLINKKITTINDSLIAKEDDWDKTMTDAVVVGDYTNLSVPRKILTEFVAHSTDYLKNIKEAGGSEDLIKAEQDLLSFEEKIIIEDFLPFEKLNINSKMTDVSLLIEKIKIDVTIEKSKLERVNNLKEEFLLKNGIKKGENPLANEKKH